MHSSHSSLADIYIYINRMHRICAYLYVKMSWGTKLFFSTYISASVGVSTFYIWLQRRICTKELHGWFFACIYMGNGCKYKYIYIFNDSMLILHTHASNCTFCIGELEGSRAVWDAGNEGYTRFSLYVLYIILLVTESL